MDLRSLHTVSLSQRVRCAGPREFKTYRTRRGNQNEQYILPRHHCLAMGRHKTEDHPPPCLKWWCGSLTTQCSSGCSAPSAKNPKGNHTRDCPCSRKTLSDSASSAVQLDACDSAASPGTETRAFKRAREGDDAPSPDAQRDTTVPKNPAMQRAQGRDNLCHDTDHQRARRHKSLLVTCPICKHVFSRKKESGRRRR